MCIHLNAVKNNKLVSIRERQRNKETGIEINKKKEGQKFSGINSYIYVYIHIESWNKIWIELKTANKMHVKFTWYFMACIF